MTDRQELRPEVIQQLASVPRIAGDRLDALLDAGDGERAVAARMLQDQAIALLREAGVIPAQATVLDLRFRQAAAICAVVGTVGDLWQLPAHASQPLQDVLKVADEGAAAWCRQVLRWGGLLPPEESSDQE